jgi:hypothetical protein
MFNGKDLSKEPPRSPRVRMGGYSILVLDPKTSTVADYLDTDD